MISGGVALACLILGAAAACAGTRLARRLDRLEQDLRGQDDRS